MSVTKATENKPQSLDPGCFLTLANPTVKADLVLCLFCKEKLGLIIDCCVQRAIQ